MHTHLILIPLPPNPPKTKPPKQGGYSTHIISDEFYTFTIPENLAIEGVAPLLCAGITVYSPYKIYGMDKAGMKIGVVGLGGLVSGGLCRLGGWLCWLVGFCLEREDGKES